MSALILWLDTQEARIFHLSPKGVERECVRRHGKRHKTETLGVNHPIEETDEERFYHFLSERLRKVEEIEWLVAGPGPGREHFLNHLERHHPALRERVCGAVKMGNLADAQIVDAGKKFFRTYHVFASTL